MIAGTPNVLVTTLLTSGLGIFDLTIPDEPALVADLTFAVREVFVQAHSADLSRFVLAGRNYLRTVRYDGDETLELEDELAFGGVSARNHRGVAVAGDADQYAVIAFFRGGMDDPISSGRILLYGIHADSGALSLLDTVEYQTPARVALMVSPSR